MEIAAEDTCSVINIGQSLKIVGFQEMVSAMFSSLVSEAVDDRNIPPQKIAPGRFHPGFSPPDYSGVRLPIYLEPGCDLIFYAI